jgi:hypothetical protein
VALDLKNLAQALGGDFNRDQVLAPGPGHSRQDRSLSITLSTSASDGFIVHSFAGDDPIRSPEDRLDAVSAERPRLARLGRLR